MSVYMSEVWEELSGAQMVVTTECEMCTAFGIAFWHGKAEVRYATELYGELADEGSWPVSKFRSLRPSQRKRKMMTRLVQEMCACSSQVEGVV